MGDVGLALKEWASSRSARAGIFDLVAKSNFTGEAVLVDMGNASTISLPFGPIGLMLSWVVGQPEPQPTMGSFGVNLHG